MALTRREDGSFAVRDATAAIRLWDIATPKAPGASMSDRHGLNTRLVHAGEPFILGAAVPPVFRSTVHRTLGSPRYEDLAYPRLSSLPNHKALADKLAAVCGAERALVTGSGMSAISATLLAHLSAGDHVIAQKCVYGGTHSLLTRTLARMGIETTFVDGTDASGWSAALRPQTRVVYTETLANPLLTVADLRGAVAFARAHDLLLVVDNTFASPVLCRPLELGADLVVHSATKFLNGHSDLAAGVVAGRADAVDAVHKTLNLLGGHLDPEGCFLLHRGLKTLSLRVRAQCANARRLARFLDAHPRVRTVHHPSLPSHPQHARATALMSDYGAMLAVELEADARATQACIEAVEVVVCSVSLGGVESLVTRPAATSHAGMTAAERASVGVHDGLVRLSVGIEDVADLEADLAQALDAMPPG